MLLRAERPQGEAQPVVDEVESVLERQEALADAVGV
jgi:hypothetical protein